VSLIFLTPFAGYSIAAFTNARIHVGLGQRGIAIIAPLCHIITYVVLAVHPPWPVLVVINIISGFGNGLTDACFCAWVGAMDKANTIQGFLHATYSVGALFAPLIATNMVVTANLPWYTFYYVMVGVSVLEWVGLTVTFWHKTGEVYRKQHERANSAQGGAGTRVALKNKVTWLCALFFFCYMGVEGECAVSPAKPL
jgi:fucose permease